MSAEDAQLRDVLKKIKDQPDQAPDSTGEEEQGPSPEDVTAGATSPPPTEAQKGRLEPSKTPEKNQGAKSS